MDKYLNMFVYILKGGLVTIKLYGVTILLAVPLGIIGAVGKVCGIKVLRKFLEFYTWLFRGTPLLLQLFFTYYGLSVVGIRLTPFTAAVITFALNYGAYFIEIFRAGIESVEKGQFEASKALGFNYTQTMRYIVLPQAIRNVLPPTCSEGINLVKDTALVATIAMQDLLVSAKQIVTREFTIVPFFMAAVIYLFMTSIIIYVFKRFEKKYIIKSYY